MPVNCGVWCGPHEKLNPEPSGGMDRGLDMAQETHTEASGPCLLAAFLLRIGLCSQALGATPSTGTGKPERTQWGLPWMSKKLGPVARPRGHSGVWQPFTSTTYDHCATRGDGGVPRGSPGVGAPGEAMLVASAFSSQSRGPSTLCSPGEGYGGS